MITMTSSLSLVTAPTLEPVDLVTVKHHLRLDTSDDDEYVEALITAARQHVEDITRRKLLTQTWTYYLPCWPRGDRIKVPFGNLQNNATATPSTAPVVAWQDTDGTTTTLTVATDYLVETNGYQCGAIVLPYAVPWPSGPLYPSNPISIQFVCGWTAPGEVPFLIQTAICMVVAKLYESRGEDIVAQTIHEDRTVLSLLASWRLWDSF